MALNPPSFPNADDAGDAFNDATGSMGDAAAGAVDTITETATDTTEAVTEVVDAAGDAATDAAAEAVSSVPPPPELDVDVAMRPGTGTVSPTGGIIPDILTADPRYTDAAEFEGRIGDVSVSVDVDGANLAAQDGLSTGGRVTVEVQGPGVDVSVDAEEITTTQITSIGVSGAIPDTGVVLGGGASVHVDPGEVAAAAGAAGAAAAAVTGDVVDQVTDEARRVSVDGDVTARSTMDDDGLHTDLDAHAGIDVDGNEVGAHTEFSGDANSSGVTTREATGDTGVYADIDGHHNEAGVTIDQSLDAEQVTINSGGGYVERDEHRAEAGFYQETDSDYDAERGDVNQRTERGVYASRDDDTVRMGKESDQGDAGEMPTTEWFVEDADGDRTGVGTIGDTKFTDDTKEAGTGGLFVDIDGERHDAHAEGGLVVTEDEVYVEVEVDPGPESARAAAGVHGNGEGNPGTVYADAGVTSEPPPVIDGLDDDGDMDLPDFPDDDLQSVLLDSDAAEIAVVVHDAVGDPMGTADETEESVDATAATVEDPTGDSNNDDDGALDDVTDAVGDAVGAVGDAIGDVIEDLFD